MFPNTNIATLQSSFDSNFGNVSEIVDDLIGTNWDEQLDGLHFKRMSRFSMFIPRCLLILNFRLLPGN